MRELAVLGFVAAALAVPPSGALRAQGDTGLVDAAAAYVRQYQEQLTSVVADETYTQRIKAQIPRDRGMPAKRMLKSEIFFMFAPGRDWMAIRDVIEMDGRPAGDRPDLKVALQTLPASEVAGRFKAHNARFNLGRVSRNFNEPTLSLLPLDQRHRARFAFKRLRAATSQGETVVTLAFQEQRPPTLIRDLQGRQVLATGEVTLEPATGRVHRAMLAMTIGSVRMTLTTDYAADARLGVWVPVRFGEHYRDGTSLSSYYEEILCEARYSNFRQFEVQTRIR